MHTLDEDGDGFWPRLFHRWFVRYNPLYLLSAALVLGGLTLVSREAARGHSVLGALGVAAIAELYAFALIGGAAFLVRIGHRRPAVMLALVAVLYQSDLTLHVETCAYLGALGHAAAAAWVALFVAKLYALAAALELRPSRSAMLVPSLGAVGLAALPQLFRVLEPGERTVLVSLFVFGVGAAALWTRRAVESEVGYDVRGVRSLRATWCTWAALGLGHVLYWCAENDVSLAALAPPVALLATRWIRREGATWAVAAGTLLATALLSPALLSPAALMVAAVLALRALRAPARRAEAGAPTSAPPYRGGAMSPPAPPSELSFARARPAALRRLLLGAAWSVHLALWTAGWSGGPWPEHVLVLDLALVLACAAAAWRLRRALFAPPVLVTAAHLAVAAGWVGAPRTALEWGVAAIGLGFAALATALAASWRWRPSAPREEDAPHLEEGWRSSA